MSRGGNYSMGKRQRDQAKVEKRRDKEERRWRKREQGPAPVEMVTAEEIQGDLPTIEQAMQQIPVAPASADNSRSAAPIPCRLFVGGLSWDTTNDTLRKRFEEFGQVADAVIVQDRETGRSRGFGFVEMANRKDAAGVINALDGSELDGRNIVVNIATERRR